MVDEGTVDSVQKMFSCVRRGFFPKWDRNHAWKVSIVEAEFSACALGTCKMHEKTITVSINALLGGNFGVLQLLIHEVTHAVTGTGHGKGWRNRMEKAAAQAEALGENDLASALRKEVEFYSDPSNTRPIPAWERYRGIRNLVFDNPGISFEEVVRKMSKVCCMTTEQFLRRFRQSRKIYGRAKKIRMSSENGEDAWEKWREKYGPDPDWAD